MRDLYILADDITGTLDTAVQFASSGISVNVFAEPSSPDEIKKINCSVAVENLNSRHLPAQDAARLVHAAVHNALEAGYSHIYKKTDSVLRGNVGAELAAVLDITGGTMEFVPAFPTMGRTTVHGEQRLNNIPIHLTSFAEDPFEPAIESNVSSIISKQTDVRCIANSEKAPNGCSIVIHDAETDLDLADIARHLAAENRLYTTAGCAGFARVLPSVIPMEKVLSYCDAPPPALMVICGSIHPNAEVQLENAQRNGAFRVSLREKWCNSFFGLTDSEKTEAILSIKKRRTVIIDVCGTSGKETIEADSRQSVADRLAAIVEDLLHSETDVTVMATGGDTLLAILKLLRCHRIHSMREIAPGTVLFVCDCERLSLHMISKAGSFGPPELISMVEDYLKGECNA